MTEIARIEDGRGFISANFEKDNLTFNAGHEGVLDVYIGIDMFVPRRRKIEFAEAILRALAPERLVLPALPTEPGTVITWDDGAYLPQIAQLDSGDRKLGWRYSNDTGAYWFTDAEMRAQIGSNEFTVLGVTAPTREGSDD